MTHEDIEKMLAEITPGPYNNDWEKGGLFIDQKDSRFIAASPEIVRQLLAETKKLERHIAILIDGFVKFTSENVNPEYDAIFRKNIEDILA